MRPDGVEQESGLTGSDEAGASGTSGENLNTIGPGQSRAARGLLGWSVTDLAQASGLDEGNDPALRLYARHGFAKIGERTGYYPRPDGSRATALTMRANLP